MTYDFAIKLVQYQKRNLKKVNGIVIDHKGYQYRLTYYGGFSEYIAIDRRQIGKRNYKYFSGIGAYHCLSVAGAVAECMEEIKKKAS